MRVALVHYWLLGSRGGEKVLEAICRMLPDADIFTLFYDPARVSPLIRSKNVQASFLNPLKRFHRGLLPLMPLALEAFDLRSYDLVISSESGPAKGVITSSNLPASLLLSHADALSLGTLPGVPERFPAKPDRARPDGARCELPAHLGLLDGRPRRPLRRQQLERPAPHLENLPAQSEGRASACRGRILSSRSFRRILS